MGLSPQWRDCVQWKIRCLCSPPDTFENKDENGLDTIQYLFETLQAS